MRDASAKDAVIPPGHYVVAGAGGLVGHHALERLARRPGISVTALHHRRVPQISAPNVATVTVDLAEPASAKAAMPRADFLLLFAGAVAPTPVLARDPVAPAIHNLRLLVNTLEAAWLAGIRKVVWLSSTTVYPDRDGAIVEDMAGEGEPPGLWQAIGWTMRYGESLCRAYSEHPVRAMSCLVLRPTLIYGAYGRFDDDAHFLPALLRRVVERQDPIEVWGDGRQSRDVVHASDVVQAAFRALDRLDGYDTFNIGAGRSVTVNEVLTLLLRLDGHDGARVVHRHDRPSTAAARSFSIEKARRVLGYAPAMELEEGLRSTLAWYRQTAKASVL